MRPLHSITDVPEPRFVHREHGVRLASYSWGDDEAPTALCVHGFASSARDNWIATGWVHDLQAAGFRVLAFDQRGHGNSSKPHDPLAYSLPQLVDDVIAVLDTLATGPVVYAGYSLGGRVGWHTAASHPDRITAGVFGGIPDGRPLQRMVLEQAERFVRDGTTPADRATRRYLALARRLPGNDVAALVSLAAGMRETPDDDLADAPPHQPILLATGTEDPVFAASERLAAAAPRGVFLPLQDRTHWTAPTAPAFSHDGIAFLRDHQERAASGLE